MKLKKLALHKETLRDLQAAEADQAQGGVIQIPTNLSRYICVSQINCVTRMATRCSLALTCICPI